MPALVEHGKVPFLSIKDADRRQPIGCLEMMPKLVAYHVPYPYTIHDELIILLDLFKSAKRKIRSVLGELAHYLDSWQVIIISQPSTMTGSASFGHTHAKEQWFIARW